MTYELVPSEQIFQVRFALYKRVGDLRRNKNKKDCAGLDASYLEEELSKAKAALETFNSAPLTKVQTTGAAKMATKIALTPEQFTAVRDAVSEKLYDLKARKKIFDHPSYVQKEIDDLTELTGLLRSAWMCEVTQ